MCKMEDDPEDYIQKHPITKLMIEKQLCFRCAFWYKLYLRSGDPKDEYFLIRANHTHWSAPKDEPVSLRKQRDHTYRAEPNLKYILFEDGRTLAVNQLYHQGNIPEHFRGIMPNNAIFISRADYLNIVNLTCNEEVIPLRDLSRCPQPLLKKLLENYDFSK